MAIEWESDKYDAVYATGGAELVYDLPYRRSGYYPLFKAVLQTLRSHGSRSILEVGCGTGGFAHLWFDTDAALKYRGFDFSPVAVERAMKRTRRPEVFFVGDARKPSSYSGEFDTIVCTEVLEHIDADLEVIEQWTEGSFCVCSVPNFPAENHVRVFSSDDQIRERYGALIDISKIFKVKKPYLFDLSWRNYLRELRWNRYRPARLARILGLAPFEKAGGWYVFAGTRTKKPEVT